MLVDNRASFGRYVDGWMDVWMDRWLWDCSVQSKKLPYFKHILFRRIDQENADHNTMGLVKRAQSTSICFLHP
jgi:hypothetical protein